MVVLEWFPCYIEQLFSVIWHEEPVPRQWREGLIKGRREGLNLLKKGDREAIGWGSV